MNEPPSGWALATTDAIFTFVTSGSRGWARYYSDEGAPFIRVGNLRRASITPDLTNLQRVTPPAGAEGTRTKVLPDDILISITADLGRVALMTDAKEATYINQHVALARPVKEINARYVAWYLSSDMAQQQWGKHQRGVTKLGLGLDDIRSVEIPIAPLAEQERIVAAIEEQFSRLDAGVVALERARQNLKRLRSEVLQAAISGRLISPDSSEPSLVSDLAPSTVIQSNHDVPANWVTTNIAAIAHVTSGATPSRSVEEYWRNGSIPWITSTLVNKETISAAREFITPLALTETSVKLMPEGALLVAMYGEGQTRGRCSELLIEATTNQACAAIALNESWKFVKPFLKLVLLASYEANRRLSSGGVQPNLSVGIIKRLPISLPPKNEQWRICEAVALQLSVIDQCDAALKRAQERSGYLRMAILAAAFSGQLAPQDPSDEPASMLLEKIATERMKFNRQVPIRRRISHTSREKATT
jgi:type I restriction enzyme, S subunit